MAIKEAVTKQLRSLSQFERVLAIVCVVIPFILLAVDAGSDRDSISAYYDIDRAHWFYVPLTAAAMMFLVNGLVRSEHTYNVFLGATLAGVLMFNHDVWTEAHAFFAVLFFVGNAVAVLISDTPRSFKIGFGVVGVLVLGAWYLFDSFTLFWAESLSLWVIAGHFLADSIEWRWFRYYNAAGRPPAAAA
jgi:hypothetical protein